MRRTLISPFLASILLLLLCLPRHSSFAFFPPSRLESGFKPSQKLRDVIFSSPLEMKSSLVSCFSSNVFRSRPPCQLRRTTTTTTTTFSPVVHCRSTSYGRLRTISAASLSSLPGSSSPTFDDASSSSSNPSSSESVEEEEAAAAPGSRLRRLKDLMWVRDAREDVTAAEFACSVEEEEEEVGLRSEAERRKRKRAVDYEKLLSQLNRRLRDMGCDKEAFSSSAADETLTCYLQPGVGMGSIVLSDQQRQSFLERIVLTRQLLMEVIRGHELYDEDELPFSITLPEIRVEIPKEDDPTSPGPKLYVRDDGTVDWDGALQDSEALSKFGTAVWARINGRDPDSIEQKDVEDVEEGKNNSQKVVTAKIKETPQIKQAREKLDELTSELHSMERSHVDLLTSAISEGQPVANVYLAGLEREQRNQIRESAEDLEKMKERVSFQTLVYELERIYAYLVGELGNPALTGYIPLQDRLNVAEFGLLESQIDNFNRQIEAGENVDTDVLAVVMDQLTDFKRRLGIDYYVTGLSWDGDAIRRWLGELLDKTKRGLAFYVKGVRLFWNDIIFCLKLINRAAQGYTLKPREVRTIRRTFKDIITFIPVVIILLIPLSPVGHVLVFGAIQRFFPDFFPSCFTEQRQNLLQLYETAEYTEFTINENWKEKLSRLSEAILYFVANTSRAVYVSVSELIRGEPVDGDKDKH